MVSRALLLSALICRGLAAAPPDLPGLVALRAKDGIIALDGIKTRDPEYLTCVLKKAASGQSLDAAKAELARAWDLSPDAAQVLLRAGLLAAGDEVRKDPAWMEATRSAYREVLRLAPDCAPARACALRFFAGGYARPASIQELNRALAQEADPGPDALALADYLEGRSGLAALAAALKAGSPEPLLLLKGAHLAAGERDPAFAAVLAQAALGRAQGATPELRGAAAGFAVQERIRCGDTAGALRIWTGLPPDVRAAVLARAETSRITWKGQGCDFPGFEDVRSALALAFHLEGRREEALALLAAGSAPKPRPGDPPMDLDLRADLVKAMTSLEERDPFDLLVRLNLSPIRGDAAWARALTAWARREDCLGALPRDLAEAWADATRTPDAEPWPADLAEEAGRLRAAFPGPAQAPAPPAPVADAATERIARLLAQPRLTPFTERPLPEGVRPSAGDGDEESKGLETLLKKLKFPGPFSPLRAERDGREAVVLGVSQGLDPVGEVSPGGYWVQRTHDGGAHWDRPLYTGLQVYRPYVVKPDSRLPMLGGAVLRLEVGIRELDEASITFPPVGLRTLRRQDGLMLEIPWQELERDRDGDGLTDLEEERLLTDPMQTDSDGDGIRDDRDPLPQVPADAARPTEGARAFRAALGAIGLPTAGAIVTGLPSKGEAGNAGVLHAMEGHFKAVEGERGALFFQGDRSWFSGMSLPLRMIVLTPAECEAWRKKFGTFYPLTIGTFFMDRKGTRAFCVWDAAWRGGSFRLNLRNGEWTVEHTGDWIS